MSFDSELGTCYVLRKINVHYFPTNFVYVAKLNHNKNQETVIRINTGTTFFFRYATAQRRILKKVGALYATGVHYYFCGFFFSFILFPDSVKKFTECMYSYSYVCLRSRKGRKIEINIACVSDKMDKIKILCLLKSSLHYPLPLPQKDTYCKIIVKVRMKSELEPFCHSYAIIRFFRWNILRTLYFFFLFLLLVAKIQIFKKKKTFQGFSLPSRIFNNLDWQHCCAIIRKTCFSSRVCAKVFLFFFFLLLRLKLYSAPGTPPFCSNTQLKCRENSYRRAFTQYEQSVSQSLPFFVCWVCVDGSWLCTCWRLLFLQTFSNLLLDFYSWKWKSTKNCLTIFLSSICVRLVETK